MRSTADPDGTVTGIHGLKRRWADPTMRDGLHRSSAAWFALDAGSAPAEPDRTIAAALYMAIGMARRAELGATTSWETLEALLSDVEQAPALLVFVDRPSGEETWRRYVWPGDPDLPTAPYTNVQRAGRTVTFTRERGARIITVTPPALVDVARAECRGAAQLAPLTWIDDCGNGPDARPPSNWLMRVCEALAHTIRAEVVPSTAR